MALLQMINSVRGKLREERISAIATTDLLTTEIVDLINDAGSEILEGDDWEFDLRNDGRLFFPSSQSGTNALFGASLTTTVYQNFTAVDLVYSGDTDSGEVFEDIDVAGFRWSGNSVRARVIPLDTPFGNTSWIITDVDHAATFLRLTLGSNLLFDTPSTNGAWTTYANEVVLPTTVKKVLSVRNEEEPVRLVFANSETEFDQLVPRPTISFSSVPHTVVVGGTITSTSRSAGTAWSGLSPGTVTATTGTGLMVWPIPSADLHLEYSYRVQHADLAAATDVFTGVPQDVIHIIEWLAFQKALDSGIQNDPVAARRAEQQVEKRRLRAQASQSRQPNRRRVPTSFHTHNHGSSRRRWANQTVPAPT